MNVRTFLGWNYLCHFFTTWNRNDTRYLICHRNKSHYKLWLIHSTCAALVPCFLIYENKPGSARVFRRSIDDHFAWPVCRVPCAMLTVSNFSKIRGCSGNVYRRFCSELYQNFLFYRSLSRVAAGFNDEWQNVLFTRKLQAKVACVPRALETIQKLYDE